MRFAYGLICAVIMATVANAETVVVARRPVIVTAQDHAVVLARRGTLIHSSCGQTEGIGCGATAQQARANCCYYRDALAGRRVIIEEGVAYSSATRRWFAVIRYR
jgi:hypothetical protein